MQIGDFVEWNLAQFTGVEFSPYRGYIVAIHGDHAVIKHTQFEKQQNPFVTLHKNHFQILPQRELVRGGATLLT